MKESRVGRGRNRLVVLNRPARGHGWPCPTPSFIVRPLDSHPEQCMHVELHHTVSPRVNVEVRVVAVSHGQECAVDILAGVFTDVDHSYQPRAAHYRSRSSGTITPASHVEIVSRGAPNGRFESRHPDAVVGPICAGWDVVTNQH